MFHLASKDWLLRLDRTVYIGDDPRDCKAAYNANCPCVYIGDTAELEGLAGNENPLCIHNNLIEAVPSILKYFKEATHYDYY